MRNNSKGIFPILSKYLFGELLYPVIFCAVGITVIFLGNTLFELTDLIVTKRVAVIEVVKILVYRLPEIFVMALPMGTLFATFYSLGRLAKDNEITIMRISGFGIHRILIPILILGILISLTVFWLNEEVAPWANHRALNILRELIVKDVTPTIKENTFLSGPDDRQFYVRQVDRTHQLFYYVIIYEMAYDGKKSSFPRVIVAKKGRFDESVWELEDGVIHEFDEAGFIIKEGTFTKMEVPVSDGLEFLSRNQKTTSEMTRDELYDDIQLFLKSGIKMDSYLVDYHRKLSSSFVPFIFVLIGAPLSIRNHRGWVIGVIIALVITFAFFVVDSLFRSLGSAGAIDAYWAAWLPLWIFGALGVILIIKEEFFF